MYCKSQGVAMLSFGQKVGLSAAGGALAVGVPAGILFGEILSPGALQESAVEAHQAVVDKAANVARLESKMPADCVRILREAATKDALTTDLAQQVGASGVCGDSGEQIVGTYNIAYRNMTIAEQNAVNADNFAEPGAALPALISTIAAFTLMGAGFGPLVASGDLGNNVASRRPAWS
jgi:hypothetical protein